MRIAVVGTGYVGLTTGVCLASLGHQVIAVDILSERVAAINASKPPFYEPGLAEMLTAAIVKGRLRATTDLTQAVAASEITFVTVGTPQAGQDIDLTYVAEAVRQIGSALRSSPSYHVVAIKSTVLAGTTDTLVRQLLEENSGKSAGEYGLCMNPEFLREGSAIDDFLNPDRIVIGHADPKSAQLLADVYDSFECPKVFTSLRNAEMIKYASNALLATLISYSNEIASLCEAIPGTDARAVLDGVHLDRRLSPIVNGQRISPGILGFLMAGCGFGGSCLPKDVNALRSRAAKLGVTAHMLDAVMSVNSERPRLFGNLVEQALGSLCGAKIAVLGLAFKAGTDDLRESASLAVIEHVVSKGGAVRAYDPIVTTAPANGSRINATLCATAEDAVTGADAALILTACPEFSGLDWPALVLRMRRQIILDGRNALAGILLPPTTRYLSIGRSIELAEREERFPVTAESAAATE
ncbi:MAG: UDP-glucose dehydrogenase family protein [Candidatus Acidiferrales bacterium]